MSDIYLSLTETPTVVTLSQPVISGALSSTVTVANTVTVALDANSLSALEQVTVTVGAAVSVSNFPASQVVSVSNFPVSSSVTVANFPSVTTVAGSVAVSNFPASSSVTIGGFSTSSLPPSTVTVANTVTINGTVTANVPLSDISGGIADYISGTDSFVVSPLGGVTFPISGTVTVGNSVTIGSLPAISGTVTANLSKLASHASSITKADNQIQIIGGYSGGSPTNATAYPLGVESTGYINSNLRWGAGVLVDTGASALPVQVVSQGAVTARLQDASGNNLTSTSIGGVQRLNVSLASAATPGGTLPSFINIHGGTDGSVARTMLLDSSGRTVVTVSNFPATQPVSLTSTTVTVSSLPSGALTTRFGSVTTANTAQITSAVTNTSRKYLLAQNISAGTVTIGIGFSPTTTQGIQLTAGGGLTFDAFCPTGAVYWLGAVTGAAFTILEG